jgi:site-specific recombinase XerD
MKIKVILRTSIVYKNGKSPLMLRFIHERTSKQLSLGVSVEPCYWDKEVEMLTADCPERVTLQSQIDSALAGYRKKIQRLEALDMKVDFDNLFDLTSKCTPQLVDSYFERQIAAMKQAGKINTAIKYTATRTSLVKFHPAKLRFEDITPNLLVDFETFLRGEGNQSNSIATKFSVLKAVYNKAVADKIFLCKENPFVLYKVGQHWTQTRKRAVHKEDIQRLIQAELPITKSPYTEFARDIFLFSYFSAGINFKDIATLRYNDMEEDRIFYRRHKTGKAMTCRLHPQAKAIIARYAHSEAMQEDYIFPILDCHIHRTEQQIHNRVHKVLIHINRELKEWSKRLGLHTPLTTYVARHTYATVLKRSGVSVALISESLGHSDLSTTQIYLDSFENSQIDAAMQHLL